MTTAPALQPTDVRLAGVGASEAAAALGLDPRRDPLGLYLLKKGLGEETPETQALRMGNVLEPLLLEEYRYAVAREARVVPAGELVEQYDPRTVPARRSGQVTVLHRDYEWLFATPDEVLEFPGGRRRGVEVKNRSAWVADRWGPSDTDELPDEVLVQCQIGMACTGLTEWGVGAYFGGPDFRTYLIPADAEVQAALIAGIRRFWLEHVAADVPPPPSDGSEATHRNLARLFRLHTDEVAEATPREQGMLSSYFEARARREKAEDTEQQLRAVLEAAIGTRAGLVGPAGKVTWKRRKDSERTDWHAVGLELLDKLVPFDRTAEAHEIIRANTATISSARVFLAKPAKAEG